MKEILFDSHNHILFHKFDRFSAVYFLKRLEALNNSLIEGNFAHFDIAGSGGVIILENGGKTGRYSMHDIFISNSLANLIV